MPVRRFGRRTYRSLGDLWADFKYIAERRRLLRCAMDDLISPGFRERLMLVVTQVNGCRYCSHFHAGQALKSGVPSAELHTLLAGQIPAETPPDEYTGLLYAQHWAETEAHPGREAVQRLVETYGEEKAAAIDVILRMIRAGNLLGNTADYLLYRLSFGLIGARKNESLSRP
jgi:AhpD family alkylhydroperoxidase